VTPVDHRDGVPMRRPGVRLGLILLVLLFAFLLVGYLTHRQQVQTVLVTDLPAAPRTTDVAGIHDRARKAGVDLLVFVVKPEAVGRRDVLELTQDGDSPRTVLVGSPKDAVIKGMPSDVRVVDENVREVRAASSTSWPGPLTAILWSLALLVTGGIIARGLMPAPAPSPPRTRPAEPAPPPPGGQGVVSTWSPPQPPQAPPAPPTRRPVDLGPFLGRKAPRAWVPQCPYCGAFGPERTRTDGVGADYACRRCGEAWHLPAGDPWPTVVVRPRHRRVR
jgi:hypothetical protein